MSEIAQVPAPGWYSDDQRPGYVRYWDGQVWTNNWQQTNPFAEARTPVIPFPVAVGNHAPVQQVVIQQPRKRVNHVFHLLMTVFTLGLWLPVWIIVAMAKS